MSMCFIEPIKKSKIHIDKSIGIDEIKDIKHGFRYVLKSERLKALILSISLIGGLATILTTYEVNLLEEIGISSMFIGIIFAILGLASSFSSNKQMKILIQRYLQ